MPDVAEVEREFRRYFMTGPVLEDWHAWANLFTDDATYFDHFYGTFTGPEEITRFLEGTMGAAPQVYSPLLWYVIDGTRVAYKVFNRADNPEPGKAPIDFPSYQFIEYAGGGKWRSEEDVWIPAPPPPRHGWPRTASLRSPALPTSTSASGHADPQTDIRMPSALSAYS